VFLTDGYINLAILNWKTEKSADVGANGPNYSGIHHFGFEVEDLDEAAAQLQRAEGQHLEEKEGLGMEMAAGGHRNFEMKWAGPDGVVIDISHTGWETKTR
jgi:catechol 2,3-dioxygenase-like lactoylglutathione lyase family enzyme